MISLLEHFFIKDDMNERQRHNAYGLISGVAGIILNLFISIFKIVTGYLANSIAVLADGLNNLSDAGASVVTFAGFKLANQKPDRDHPYGHGRMEYIAGLAVAGLILLMGATLFKDSLVKVFRPEATTITLITVVSLVASIVVKVYMAMYNRKLANITGSSTIKAVCSDSLNDCLATSMTLVALLVEKYSGFKLDGYCGLIVAVIVLRAGWNVFNETLDPLLGQPPQESFVKSLEEIVLSFDERILGMHDMMVHDYGPGRKYVTLHAEVPSRDDVLVIHEIIDSLEKKIGEELGCYITIHMDPIVMDDAYVNGIRESLAKCVKMVDSCFTIHDVRVVLGEKNTNIIFDVVVPVGYELSDREVMQRIKEQVRQNLGDGYSLVITVDKHVGVR